MAYRYELLSDFQQSQGDGVISVTPSWLLVVIPFAQRATFDRNKLFSNGARGDASLDLSASDIIATKSPLIISSDCIQLMTQASKSTHICTLSASLLHGSVNYIAEIMPGDWVFAWIANSQEKIDDLIQRVSAMEACNDFTDGLKFIGRVQSVRESTQIDRSSGHKRTRYQVQACGFKEFDTTVFYDPAFQRNFADVGDFISALGKSISDFITEGLGIDVNKAIPLLLTVLLGEGLPTSITDPSGIFKITAGSDAPNAYIIPRDVADLLGRTPQSKGSGVASYADILDVLIGLQRYSDSKSDNGQSVIVRNEFRNYDMFIPTGVSGTSTIRSTNKPLMGAFVPHTPQFTNKPIWSVLYQYLNPAINEMYTCLRVNNEKQVVPHVVVRQFPFSTPIIASQRADVTPFHELPRWGVDPLLVYNYDIGRSNALRFNFIHVYGFAPFAKDNFAVQLAIVRAPPVRDGADIARNGLFADLMEVATDLNDQYTGPDKWLQIRADWQLNLHLTLNGTINMVGIQSPICVGDNLEFDDTVYHIEGVAHTCSIDTSGRRSFTTTLQISHGMRTSAENAASSVVTASGAAEVMYPAMVSSDQRKLQSGLTYEGDDLVVTDDNNSSD